MYKVKKTSNQLRPVIVLLITAVILPTVCLLWFMTQAVKNERLAVRQKLIDFYTDRAQSFFIEGLNTNVFRDDILSLETQAKDARYGEHPAMLFEWYAAQTDSMFNALLIYGPDGKPLYPVMNSLAPGYDNLLQEPFQCERTGDLEKAVGQYDTIAQTTTSDTWHDQAILAMARCLGKLGRTPQAIELVQAVAYPKNPFAMNVQRATVAVHAQVFLAELYKGTQDEKLTEHLGNILSPWSGHAEKDAPFIVPADAETIVWQLNRMMDMAWHMRLDGALRNHIALARRRTSAYEQALWAASYYPDAAASASWPNQTIRAMSADSDLYGLWFTLGESTVLGIAGAETALAMLHAAATEMQDDTVSVQITDNLGRVIVGPKEMAGDAFVTMSLGAPFPEFTAAVYFKDSDVFANAAEKQTALYLWTGILVAVLILVAGTLAVRSVNRQMALNRLKNDFIATVSHELKTPLAAMRVLADTLLEGRYHDSQQAQEYLTLITQENARLSRLIDNFLTFSRMERNKQAFDMVPAAPADIAAAAVQAVQMKFGGNTCHFSVDIQESLPLLMADKDAMVTVLVNLLDNAYKYTTDHDKRIALRVFGRDHDVCFAVRDNGLGLTRRQMRKIFDRFYQADRSLSRRAEGTGLGLSIVKFIVDAHKGKIDVQSKPGRGSEFTVTFSGRANGNHSDH